MIPAFRHLAAMLVAVAGASALAHTQAPPPANEPPPPPASEPDDPPEDAPDDASDESGASPDDGSGSAGSEAGAGGTPQPAPGQRVMNPPRRRPPAPLPPGRKKPPPPPPLMGEIKRPGSPPPVDPSPIPPTTGPSVGDPGGPEKIQDLSLLPPPIRAGVRVNLHRQRRATLPYVVIVSDATSYLAALSAWTPTEVFPVLLDDGTWETQEDIARFVRGFEPAHVVRWRASEDSAAWSDDAAVRRASIESAVREAWDVREGGDVRETWRTLDMAPPLVVAAADDETWPAAAALAAGHPGLLVWVTPPKGVDGTMPLEALTALSTAIEAGTEAQGFPWKDLGDAVDAIALCGNVPVRVALPDTPENRRVSGGGVPLVATSDLAGWRTEGTGEQQRAVRWAMCGQLFGTEAQSAYRAMCSLFLVPTRAWLFDGYESKAPYLDWDATKASKILDQLEFPYTLDDAPRQGIDDFRRRASGAWSLSSEVKGMGGVPASLVCVNTSGNPDYFDLAPGRGFPGDTPFLQRPAVVYFVHSWSATAPASRATIAGRWLERGAYAYFGSIQEPFLQSFVPTPNFLVRFFSPAPMSFSARLEGRPPWKLAMLGDPLVTPGSPRRRVDAALPLEGAIDLADDLALALRERRFSEAAWCLVLLGRDEDASRLARALLREGDRVFTTDVAEAVAMSLFRTVDESTFLRAAAMCRSQFDAHPFINDALWHALWPRLTSATLDEVRLLANALRMQSIVRDSDDLAKAMARLTGNNGARELLRTIRDGARDAAVKDRLDEMMRRY